MRWDEGRVSRKLAALLEALEYVAFSPVVERPRTGQALPRIAQPISGRART